MKSLILKSTVTILGLSFLLANSQAWAWGERGHHTICEVAARLVSNPELADFLKSRTHMMGHVCNIPDIYWRDLGDIAKSGDATHFMNPENLSYSLETVPLDINQIIADKQGKPSDVLKRNIDVMQDLGSGWWRYDQFARRATADVKLAKSLETAAATPAAQGQSGNPSKDQFNAAVLSMITDMGLMGHFIGDASQPMHNTNDYDGWNTGHGGLHSFYETRVVNELPMSLEDLVYQEALKVQKAAASPANLPTAIESIRSVAVQAFADMPLILKADAVLAPSQINTGADAKLSKIPAKRKNPSEVVNDFSALIVHEMALSAAALAQTWDQIYVDGGKPSFRSYSSYTYPLQPAFVAPDYGPAH